MPGRDELLLPRREAIRQAIEENKDSADTSRARDQFFRDSRTARVLAERELSIDAIFPLLITGNRAQTLNTFQDFFASNRTAIAEAVGNYVDAIAPGTKRLPKGNIRYKGASVDTRIYNPDDPYNTPIEAILRDPMLRQAFLNRLDGITQASTRRVFFDIEKAREQGKLVRKPLGIIGDGPVGDVAAAILGQIVPTTIITSNRLLTGHWRGRVFFLNSDGRENNPFGPQLPLLEGTTSPITPFGFGNLVSLPDTQEEGGLEVLCPTGSKLYLSGSTDVGPRIATNLLSAAEDFVLGQTVLFEETKIREDGVVLRLEDSALVANPTRRRLFFDRVIVATGPGKEVSKVQTTEAQALYKDSAIVVDEYVAETLTKLTRGEKPEPLVLPPVMTLTSAEKLYLLWMNELQSNPEYFPFQELFNDSVEVAIAGKGDTGKVWAGLLTGQEAPEAYPNFLPPLNIPKITIYKFSGNLEDLRRRYRVTLEPGISRGKIVFNQTAVRSYEATPQGVRVTGDNGVSKTFRVLFDATGIKRSPIEEQVPFTVVPFYDVSGRPVGWTDEMNKFIVLGTAAESGQLFLPLATRRIVQALQTPENPVALWARIPPAERGVWQFARGIEPDLAHIDRLLRSDPGIARKMRRK